jgi:hypothetical protein
MLGADGFCDHGWPVRGNDADADRFARALCHLVSGEGAGTGTGGGLIDQTAPHPAVCALLTVTLFLRLLKRSKNGPQSDHRGERQQAGNGGDHDNIKVTLAVSSPAHSEEGDHGAVVRQAVERA